MSKFLKTLKEADWILILFLFMVCNQAYLILKPLGFLFIYLLRPNLKFGFFKGRIPKFYLYIILLAGINLLIHIQDHSKAYMAAFSVASAFWLACLLAHHQIRLSLEKYGANRMHATLKAFTIINLLFCALQLINIVRITGHLNPYRDLPFPYGMSTGDNVFGFFMQNCYYNVMVSAFLCVYFLFRRNVFYCLLSAISLLLVFANTGTLLFIGTVGVLFIASLLFGKEQDAEHGKQIKAWLKQVSLSRKYALYIPLVVVFIIGVSYLVSPENFRYSEKRMDNNYGSFKPRVPGIAGIKQGKHSYPVYNTKNPDMKAFILSTTDNEPIMDTPRAISKGIFIDQYLHKQQGKKLAFIETALYLKSSVPAFFLGAGPARFSSQLAQRMSGLDSSRIFMKYLPQYLCPMYAENHWLIIYKRYRADESLYSNANWPDSFYNQLLGEYGVLGVLLFIIFYIGFFIKDIRYLSYGFWISGMLLAFALVSYLFEPLAAVLFFELLMMTDIAENKAKQYAGASS